MCTCSSCVWHLLYMRMHMQAPTWAPFAWAHLLVHMHEHAAHMCVCVSVMCLYAAWAGLCSAGAHEGRREHTVPSFTTTQPQLVARYTAVFVCGEECACLVLPEGCSGDVMNHLNEGQGVWCGSTAVTHTLQTNTDTSPNSWQDIVFWRMFVDHYLLIKALKLSHATYLTVKVTEGLNDPLPVQRESWQTSGAVCSA